MYLVRADISYTPYMGNRGKPKEDIRIVKAENAREAREKYENYWAERGNGDDSYNAHILYVNEMIE